MFRVGLITQPPSIGGGTFSLVRFLYRALEQTGNCRPVVISRVPWRYGEKNFRLLNLAFGRALVEAPLVGFSTYTLEGMNCLELGGYFPEWEPIRYLPNHLWHRTLNNLDVCIVVGGSILSGFPACSEGVNYISWVASPFWEDRLQRFRVSGALRKFYYISSRLPLHTIEGRVARKSRMLMVTSPYSAEIFCTRHHVAPERVKLVPCPVDVNFFRPTRRSVASSSVRLISIGRFTDPRKNLPLLLHAFQLVRVKRHDVSLTILGRYNQEEVNSLKSRWPCVETVQFLGFVTEEEKAEALRRADLFVCSSQQEGFGITLIEAMASGLPVVSTRCGGPKFIIRPGENGILVENENAQALSAAILSLAGDHRLLRRMGATARRDCKRYYSQEAIARSIFEEIEKVWKINLTKGFLRQPQSV